MLDFQQSVMRTILALWLRKRDTYKLLLTGGKISPFSSPGLLHFPHDLPEASPRNGSVGDKHLCLRQQHHPDLYTKVTPESLVSFS